MNNFIINIQKKISEKATIIVSLFTIVFSVLSCILEFICYEFNVNVLIFGLLTAAPSVLLVVYLTKFHKNLKATGIVPVIFGLVILYEFWAIWNLLKHFSRRYYIFDIFMLTRFVFEIVRTVSFIAVLSNVLKGMTNKKLITIAMLVCIVSKIPNTLYCFSDLIMDRDLYSFTSLMPVLVDISLYMSLLLFGVKNKIPALITSSIIKKVGSENSPEKSLKLLKDKLELGMITEEEYQTQRMEIIKKL